MTTREKTVGRARLSFANEADIDEFANVLAGFERGDVSAEQWRSFRLLRGTYGQRQADDAQMIRVKIPQGVLTASQLGVLADVAEEYSRGFGHITTRQNVQFHFVRLADVEPAMRRLAAEGLTTREACGNSVRNITACAMAGVSPSEVFDVTPYAERLSRYLLRHPLSGALPRKFKIAFEGCTDDHVKLAINDIGWKALERDGARGFRVLVGGGTATMATSARTLMEFVPAERMCDLAEAIVRVFHVHGDYQHRARNRMKFLIKALGWSRFSELVHEEFLNVLASDGTGASADLPETEAAPSGRRRRPPSVATVAARVSAAVVRGPGIVPAQVSSVDSTADDFARWRVTNVRPQRQAGFAVAVVTVPLGDLTAAQLRVVGDLAEAFGDGAVRVTLTQNLVLRWVPVGLLRALHDRLTAAGLGRRGADSTADVTSCPGAESCKLAVTQSRGLGQLLGTHADASDVLSGEISSLDVKVSGCPNGCGQHHIAAVGFQGSLRKVAGRPAPYYFVMVGGGVTESGATFGRLAAKVPARRAPVALDRLAALYRAERELGESASAFFARVGIARVKSLLADLEPLTAETASDLDFVDLAETSAFSPEQQEGECSA